MKPVNSTVDRSGNYFQLITGSNDDGDNDADIDDYDHVDVDNDDDASDGDVDEANNFNNNNNYNNYNNNSNSNNEYNQKLLRGVEPVSCSVFRQAFWFQPLKAHSAFGSLIGQLSFLLVPNMVLSKMNNHEHRTKQTYESYTFQPLMSFWCNTLVVNKYPISSTLFPN